MAENGDLQHEILQKTLNEVADEHNEGNPCVICLESVTEPSIANPCHHTNFDFLCLVSWLEQQPTCPLCKTQIENVQYDLNTTQGPKTYHVPPKDQPGQPSREPASGSRRIRGRLARHGLRRDSRAQHPYSCPPSSSAPDDPLAVRRNVYRNQLYSLRVGSNRLSQYSEVTAADFNRDEALVSRARKWIRRELQVFSFLNPETEAEPSQGRYRVSRPGAERLENRRANNAEFLLEYVIAILRTVDIRGSAGQAEELLRDFIGRDYARLFLHELLAWLRSPYVSLQDWDRHVQYPSPNQRSQDRDERVSRRDHIFSRGRRQPRGRTPSSRNNGNDRSLFDRISRPGPDRETRRRIAGREVSSRSRPYHPPRNILDRYIPD